MGSSTGHLFRVTTFGESHGPAVGVIVDGCPPGLPLDAQAIQADLDRRRPGTGKLTSRRAEPDTVELLSGVVDGLTLGTPIALMVRNVDCRPEEYEDIAKAYRPGHADYATEAKYGRRDARGGGRSSARETVGRVAAGAVARRLLANAEGTDVLAWVDSIGEACATRRDTSRVTREAVEASPVRCPYDEAAALMQEQLESAARDGDSVGGVVSCIAGSMPLGLGEPVFDKLTADLAKAMMSIPASRGFEIGEGFAAGRMRGSEHNDSLRLEGGRVVSSSNLAGGASGGISTGEELLFRVAFKPAPTIARPQRTTTSEGEETMLTVSGRHDPCVAVRAAPVVEAMTLLVLADHYLRHRALTGPK